MTHFGASELAAVSQADTPLGSNPQSPITTSRTPSDPIELIRSALAKVDWATFFSPSIPIVNDPTFSKDGADSTPYPETFAKADQLKRSESPFEACLSDSVGSPDSARDFLTSPSLFDDCDFEFDEDAQNNFPLFPGPSFDSQVITAAPLDDDIRFPASTPSKMGSDQSRPASPTNLDMNGADSTNEEKLRFQHDMMAELEGAGLLCFMIKKEEADDDAARTQILQRQRLFGQAILQEAFQNGSRLAPFIKMKHGDSNDLKDLARRDGGTLAQTFGRLRDHAQQDVTPPRDATPADLVPYYKDEEVMTTSGSTLAMTLQTSAPIHHAMAAGRSSLVNNVTTNDLEIPAAPSQNATTASPKAEEHYDKHEPRVGPVRRKRTRRQAPSPISVSKARATEEGKAASSSPAPVLPKGKRFQCDVCSKWFDRAFNLKTHMFTHEDPDSRSKDFICPDDDCSKAFARKHDMKRHFNTVHLKIVKRSSGKKSSAHVARDDDQG